MARLSLKNALLLVVFLILLGIIGKTLKKRRRRAALAGDFPPDALNEGLFEQMEELYAVPGVDCKGVLEGDSASLSHALEQVAQPQWQGFHKTEADYVNSAKSCDIFIRERGYITSVLSEEEENFPLAYSIMVYKDMEPVERLFRAIYRPHNFYCFHVDKKAEPEFFSAMQTVLGCFPNAFIASERIDVKWSQFSVLEPELVCMKELFSRSADWRYFINLTGQEFPLRTNRELVEILNAYKGANDVEGVRKKANKFRWEQAGPPPLGLTPTKGSVHVALNRKFVDFILHDPRSKQIQDWVRPQEVSDETFFSTINHNPQLGVPGSFIGLDDVETIMGRKPYFARYRSVQGEGGEVQGQCTTGRRVHGVCVFATGDLPHIHQAPHFFANDFYLHEDRLVYACLEQRLHNATRSRASITTKRQQHQQQQQQQQQAAASIDTDTTLRLYRDSTTVRHRLIGRQFGTLFHERSSQGEHAEHMKNCYDGTKCDPKYLLWDDEIGMIRYQGPKN